MKKIVIMVSSLIIVIGVVFALVLLNGNDTNAGNYYRSSSASEGEKDLYQFSKSDAENFTEEEKEELKTIDESPVIDKDMIKKRAESAAKISDKSQREWEKTLEEKSIRNQALYLAAKEEGLKVTGKELDDAMKKLKELYDEDAEYKKEVDASRAGYDLTIDEYWKAYREQQRYSMMINKYEEGYYTKMASKEKIEPYTPEYYNKQKKWYEELTDKMIQKFKVRVE